MLNTLGLEINNIKDYISSLKKAGIVREAVLRRHENNEVEFIVEKCSLAFYTHGYVISKGLSGHVLCPLATTAMLILALEKGWRPGDQFFKYVKFTGELSRFNETGTITRFKLV